MIDQAILVRFWDKVDKDGENSCWLWKASCTTLGYGRFSYNGIKCYAHRFIYEATIGKVPDGYELDHLCRNPRCVNPSHLEPVRHRVNCQRGLTGYKTGLLNKSKTHCPMGHPYDEENTIYDKKNQRTCRICRRISKLHCRLRKGIQLKPASIEFLKK